MSENAVEILFQRTATVIKVEVERQEIRDDKYKVTGHKIVRTVTVSVPYGKESYHTRELLFEHPDLQPGAQVRIVVTSEPALTEADLVPSKVTEISS